MREADVFTEFAAPTLPVALLKVNVPVIVMFFPFPDLSFHAVTVDPDFKQVVGSDASNHREQLDRLSGVKGGVCVISDDIL